MPFINIVIAEENQPGFMMKTCMIKFTFSWGNAFKILIPVLFSKDPQINVAVFHLPWKTAEAEWLTAGRFSKTKGSKNLPKRASVVR